jgi:hypothetical protein
MHAKSPVEIADQLSRKRAKVIALATVMFLVAQVGNNPFLNADHLHSLKINFWALNAILLLIGLATGGTLLKRRNVRMLMNDELTQSHLRTSMATGFWTAMATAMGLYWFALLFSKQLTGEEAIYLVVTASVSAALLTFSWLEHRALRDA